MATDITAKKDTELREELTTKREALRTFRFAIAGSQGRNVREGRNLRRDIARLLTELNRRTIAS